MRVSKKAVVLLAPSLLFGLGAPAWSASSDQAPVNAQVAPANPEGNSLVRILSPILTDTDPPPRQPKQNCNASQLYSQHDVVGDPDSCVMGHYSTGVGQNFAAPVSVP